MDGLILEADVQASFVGCFEGCDVFFAQVKVIVNCFMKVGD